MQESQRRVALGIRMLEQELSQRPWLASNQYSLADINGFNLAFALPLSQPALSNDELTPNILRWLRTIYARPATKACWAMGRTNLAKRVAILEQPHIGQGQLA
jgi:glutathione S-transferase/GST-like protein